VNTNSRHSCESGNPVKIKSRAAEQNHNCVSRREDNLINWIPAFAGMTKRHLISVILILLLTTPAAQAEGLGRLFFTPAQRVQLNHHNYKPAATVTNTDIATDGEETDRTVTVTVNGIVQRNGGKRTAWINGAARTVEQSDDNASVMVNLPDQNKMVQLKVGQHVKLSPAASPNTGKPSVEKQTPANDD
jgi:hypothetical protein